MWEIGSMMSSMGRVNIALTRNRAKSMWDSLVKTLFTGMELTISKTEHSGQANSLKASRKDLVASYKQMVR